MKIIYFITCCLMIIKGFGQINTIKIVTDKKIESIQAYDSLKNFLGRDIKKYIGQDLYLYGGIVPSITKEYGYENFYTKILDKYERPAKSNVYKCCAEKSFAKSEYEALKEKYFKVIDVVDGKNYDEYYLKLVEKNSNDIVYFKYNQENKYAFPFFVVGFVEKLKNNVVGKDFVFTKNSFKKLVELLDKKATEYADQAVKCINCEHSDKCYKLTKNYHSVINLLK